MLKNSVEQKMENEEEVKVLKKKRGRKPKILTKQNQESINSTNEVSTELVKTRSQQKKIIKNPVDIIIEKKLLLVDIREKKKRGRKKKIVLSASELKPEKEVKKRGRKKKIQNIGSLVQKEDYTPPLPQPFPPKHNILDFDNFLKNYAEIEKEEQSEDVKAPNIFEKVYIHF